MDDDWQANIEQTPDRQLPSVTKAIKYPPSIWIDAQVSHNLPLIDPTIRGLIEPGIFGAIAETLSESEATASSVPVITKATTLADASSTESVET